LEILITPSVGLDFLENLLKNKDAHGIDINQRNAEQLTPLGKLFEGEFTDTKQRVAEMLVQKGPDLPNIKEGRPFDVQAARSQAPAVFNNFLDEYKKISASASPDDKEKEAELLTLERKLRVMLSAKTQTGEYRIPAYVLKKMDLPDAWKQAEFGKRFSAEEKAATDAMEYVRSLSSDIEELSGSVTPSLETKNFRNSKNRGVIKLGFNGVVSPASRRNTPNQFPRIEGRIV
jgi:hypothetical protein